MTASEKSKSYFPLTGSADDCWSKKDEATATFFCGAVQLAFVSPAPESLYLLPQLLSHSSALTLP